MESGADCEDLAEVFALVDDAFPPSAADLDMSLLPRTPPHFPASELSTGSARFSPLTGSPSTETSGDFSSENASHTALQDQPDRSWGGWMTPPPRSLATSSDGGSQAERSAPNGQTDSSTSVSATPKPTTRPKQTKASKRPKRSLGYNPNRAREELRKEVLRLRTEATELEEQLEILRRLRPCRDAVAHDGASRAVALPAFSADIVASNVWKAMAQRQLQKRMASTHESCKLRSAVQANEEMISRMSKMLRSHNAERMGQAASIRQALRIPELARYPMDPAVVDRLFSGAAKCYQDVENVFRCTSVDVSSASSFSLPEIQRDSSGNLFSQVFGSKILPYTVDKAAVAAWTHFSDSVRPNARCFVDEVVQASDNAVLSRFGTELHKDGAKMSVFGWQLKRRFVEADRVVIVWQALTEPLEFKGRRVSGASFEEHGLYMVHKPPLVPDGFSMLRTCYRMAPTSPLHSMPMDSTGLAVTDFLLNWMATTIPANHGILEDILFDAALAVSS